MAVSRRSLRRPPGPGMRSSEVAYLMGDRSLTFVPLVIDCIFSSSFLLMIDFRSLYSRPDVIIGSGFSLICGLMLSCMLALLCPKLFYVFLKSACNLAEFYCDCGTSLKKVFEADISGFCDFFTILGVWFKGFKAFGLLDYPMEFFYCLEAVLC